MGWQTWCSVGPCGEDHCFDGQIREMADTLVSSGMVDLGYNWVILDDCWHPSRDDNGTLVPFPRFFPNGMKPVIDYVHSKGLQFGLYTSVGDATCHGGWSPGSFGHYEQDANTFASWGVDCALDSVDPARRGATANPELTRPDHQCKQTSRSTIAATTTQSRGTRTCRTI